MLGKKPFMKKRRAFIGLGSPLFYDYKSPAHCTENDRSSSPNPVLDASTGLMLLYDELWFLCESLCPQNLRGRSFVKYVDREGLLSGFNQSQITWDRFQLTAVQEDRRKKAFSIYREVIRRAGINWDASPDNHTHSLSIGPLEVSANSISPAAIGMDLLILEHLKDWSFDYVTNTFSSDFILPEQSGFFRAKLTEELVIDRVPNYLQQLGPYHPCIEEAREHRYLVEFRSWISTETAPKNSKDVAEIKKSVKEALRETQKNLLEHYFSKTEPVWTLSKSLGGMAADLLLPGVGSVIDVHSQYKEEKEKQKVRWQGFLLLEK
jgi:hypothetical protein